MKTNLLVFLVLVALISCKSPIVTTQMERVWVVKEATHIQGSRIKVYVKGQGGNLFNYDPFVLDLSDANSVKFTDVAQGGDRFDFTGKWRVEQNVKLVLFDLSPEPTCSDGVDCVKDGIQFFIDKVSENELKINRLYRSDKTGDTVNEYILIPK